MSDKEFEKLLKQVTSSHRKYKELLDKAEAEYERRFGSHPSDVDDDYWIDSFHENPTGASLEEVKRSAEICKVGNKW